MYYGYNGGYQMNPYYGYQSYSPYNTGYGTGGLGYSAAIILVLFILLVVIFGAGFLNNGGCGCNNGCNN